MKPLNRPADPQLFKSGYSAFSPKPVITISPTQMSIQFIKGLQKPSTRVVILAGDSAHANNPIGGMGLNGGIHDAINLAEKLGKVWRGEASEDLIGLYSRQRHKAASNFIQAQTIANKKMMEDSDPKVEKSVSMI